MKRLVFLFLTVLLLFSLSCGDTDKGSVIEGDEFELPEIYHDPDEIEAFLQQTHSTYPAITELETVGTSASGRSIYSLIISDNPDTFEVDEPRVRLTGSIHGNEYISGEILIKYIEYLTENYSSSTADLVNNRYIAIIPALNPDGLEASTRYNTNGVDLNRNFSREWTAGGNHGSAPFSEPETAAFRDYSLARVFHLSATFHSGEVVVNMPFDYVSESGDGIVPVEYDLVKYMAKDIYTQSGDFLDTPGLRTGTYVDAGTINGGDWYVITGSLQDWSYLETGCLDLTVEVADSSPLDSAGIEEYFLYNRDSITAYINAAGTGVYGVITDDSSSDPVAGASVLVNDGSGDGDLVTTSDSNGYYYKILKPGSYTLKVSADGYDQFSQVVTITDLNDTEEISPALNPQ
jgi:carboxypeptidase D